MKALIEEDLLSDISEFIVRHKWAGLALIKVQNKNGPGWL